MWLADQRERAGAIRVPTLLIICGEPGPRHSAGAVPWLAQSIPGARQAVIEGAGHLGNLETPAEFDTLVGAFIRGVDSRLSSRSVLHCALLCHVAAMLLRHASGWSWSRTDSRDLARASRAA